MSEILIAILSAITGAILRPVFDPIKAILWDKLIPNIVERHNKHTQITGKWKVMHIGNPADGATLGARWEIIIDAKQTGNVVTGTATSTCKKGASSIKGKFIEYRLEGNFYSSILNATLHPKDQKNRLRASFLLDMKGDGGKLVGHHLFVGKAQKGEPIRSIACEWVSLTKDIADCGAA